MASEKPKLEALEEEYAKINKLPRLTKAVEHVDKIIELLSAAREQVASGKPRFTLAMRYGRGRYICSGTEQAHL